MKCAKCGHEGVYAKALAPGQEKHPQETRAWGHKALAMGAASLAGICVSIAAGLAAKALINELAAAAGIAVCSAATMAAVALIDSASRERKALIVCPSCASSEEVDLK